MIADGISVLVTFDKNLEYHQNFDIYPLTIIVLTAVSNQHKHLQPLVAQVNLELADPQMGVTIIG